jgi:hypothetical protein
MPIINKGTAFSNGEQLTADKLNDLVDLATFDQSATDSASTTVNTSGQIAVKDNGVSTSKIADANVTKAKIENVADYKVLGNVSGTAAAPQEVAILDEDTMSSNSATSLATQQSIKAYVDAGDADPSRVYNSLTHSTVSANIQQNTAGRPLWVSFTLYSNDNIDVFQAKISSSSDMSSSTQIGQSKIASDSNFDSAAQLTMIVPDQWYWQFTHVSTSETGMVHSSFIL